MRYSFKHVTMVLALCIPLLAVGCAGSLSQHYAQLHVYTGTPLSVKDVDHELELADQMAVTGSFYDNPLRLVGYALYPVGAMLEYVVTRPAYFVASLAPHVSGYTVEDATLADPEPIRASQ